MKSILIDAYPRSINAIFTPEDLEQLRSVAPVIWAENRPMPPEEFTEAVRQSAFIIRAHRPFGSLKRVDAPELRAIFEVMGGHPKPDILDYDTCFRRNIRVLSCAPAFAPQVAEMALGMTLAATREIATSDRAIRKHTEAYSSAGNTRSFTLRNKVVGFIGFGNIAKELMRLLAPFRTRVLAYDPWLPESELVNSGAVPVELDQLLTEARVIFVLARATKANRGLLSRARLELIHSNGVLVLVSRAHLVDFDALVDLLAKGRFRAAIDVYPEEPLPEDHPVRNVDNAVLTAHLAGAVPDSLTEIGRMVLDDVKSMVAGFPPTRCQVAQPELVNRRD